MWCAVQNFRCDKLFCYSMAGHTHPSSLFDPDGGVQLSEIYASYLSVAHPCVATEERWRMAAGTKNLFLRHHAKLQWEHENTGIQLIPSAPEQIQSRISNASASDIVTLIPFPNWLDPSQDAPALDKALAHRYSVDVLPMTAIRDPLPFPMPRVRICLTHSYRFSYIPELFRIEELGRDQAFRDFVTYLTELCDGNMTLPDAPTTCFDGLLITLSTTRWALDSEWPSSIGHFPETSESPHQRLGISGTRTSTTINVVIGYKRSFPSNHDMATSMQHSNDMPGSKQSHSVIGDCRRYMYEYCTTIESEQP